MQKMSRWEDIELSISSTTLNTPDDGLKLYSHEFLYFVITQLMEVVLDRRPRRPRKIQLSLISFELVAGVAGRGRR